MIFTLQLRQKVGVPHRRCKGLSLACKNSAYVMQLIERSHRSEIVNVKIKYLITQLSKHRVIKLKE